MIETETIQLTKEETELVYSAQVPAPNPLFPLKENFLFEKKAKFPNGVTGIVSVHGPFDHAHTDAEKEFDLFVNGEGLDESKALDSFLGHHDYAYNGNTYSINILPDPAAEKPVTFCSVPDRSGSEEYLVTIPTEFRFIKAETRADCPAAAVETAVRYLLSTGAEIRLLCERDLSVENDYLLIDDSFFPLTGITVESYADVTKHLLPKT